MVLLHLHDVGVFDNPLQHSSKKITQLFCYTMPGEVLLFGNTVYSVSVRVKGYRKAPLKLLRITVIARLEGLASD